MVTVDGPEPGRGPAAPRGQSSASRRAGYAIAALINAFLLYVVAVWPGWRSLRVLTADAALVVPWVDAALVAGIVVNLLNLLFDRRWLRAVGDLVTTVIGLVAVIVTWDVFPFDFSAVGGGWEVIARIALLVAIAGSAIGIIVAVVRIVRIVIDPSSRNSEDTRAGTPTRTKRFR